MPLQIIDGPIIAAGESLSDAVDCTAGDVVRITMPADWTAAQLTFEVSSDGQFFNPLYYHDGSEVVFEVIPGSAVLIPSNITSALAHLKFRSGTRDHPKPQPSGRLFAIAIDVREVAGGNSPALPIRLVT
ncbi:hypothetical protein [Bradyrhizobium sp. 1(2017)]|uniref:hypothetical protein n=1 Tax=Bradyrhizobium sp. 1(2017) TaxID=1404888 RepID=UPI00140ED7FD|nr:hypothetical protein [Bradyrhizobium sp. 1(2017)]QIO34322.1 hypothetical protein HAP40_22260 [Bradyrhizobium sp. 1(2017)]